MYGAMVDGSFLIALLPWLPGRRRGCCSAGWRCRWRSGSCAPCAAHTDGPTLNEALAQTGMLQLAFCLLLSAGILAS